MSVIDWSPRPSGNAMADPNVPANDSMAAREFPRAIRGVMAAVKADALDRGGALSSAGSANAYTVTTSAGIGAPAPGASVSFRADRSNTAEPTLAVDGTTARQWLDVDGTA